MVNQFQSRGGSWVLAQSLIMAGCLGAGLVWTAAPAGRLFTSTGVVFLAVAALCGSLGALALGRNLTPFPGPSSSGTLVQTGIYGLMRHPLYTAVGCAAIGWALLRVSWPAMLMAVTLMVFFDFKARHEERLLRAKFPAYTDYQRRVKRFIPWLY